MLRLCLLLLFSSGSLWADLLQDNRDPKTAPQVDFWLHANAKWNETHPLSDDRASFFSYDLQQDIISHQLIQLQKQLRKQTKRTPAQEQIVNFWHAAMHFEKNPLQLPSRVQDVLNRLDQATSPQQILEIAGDLTEAGVGSFIGIGPDQDARDENKVVLYLNQSGLSLPDRSFYLGQEPQTKKVRDAFPAHVARMLQYVGYSEDKAKAASQNILAFETRLAEASRSLEQLEDPEKNYNLMTRAQLDALCPGLQWGPALKRAGAPETATIVVGQPEFLAALAKVLQSTPAAVIHDYLRFQAINDFAPVLNATTANDSFKFTGQVLAGTKAQRSLEDRAIKEIDGSMGDLVGREYVARHFSAAQRKRFRQVAENIRQAFTARLKNNAWMDEKTKSWALNKLSVVHLRVGYPDKWRDYTDVAINPNNLAENILACDRWETRRAYARVGGLPEREEWGMRPYTVNAYYNPMNNEIVLPAAILCVPGYEGDQLDDAVLYGYIATTIGHELTHGFDDSGRHYGAKGRLEEGWTPETEKAFAARCDKLVELFNREEPLPGVHVNGKQTLCENIADLGGLEIALDAFRQTDAYKSGKKLNGQSPLERFFLAYAYSFAGSIRKEALNTQLLSDTHSPMIQRINTALRNVDDFHTTFGIKSSDPMWLAPADRVKIW
jgi:putative endopeptidase